MEQTKNLSLTKEQEDFILNNYKVKKDLNILTQECFKDPSLDGRSIQGKLIRAFLVKNKLDYKTTKHIKVDSIEFTDAQKHFIIQSAEQGMSSFAIAELLFTDKEVKKLGAEQRAVLEHIRSVNENFVPSQESGLLTSYSPPKTYPRLIKKIFDSTGFELHEFKLARHHKNCLDRLAINLCNSRFIKIMNNYTSKDDRNLFEEEFTRLTWDKPDLTADELNLYMNVCKEIINLEVISKHLNKLNDLFDSAEEQNDMSVKLAEIIKAKSGEYHQCENRIEALTKKLQGDRSERMKNKQRDNASILSLVQMFQEEDERKNMIHIAEMQKKLVSDEADRLEGMAAFKARVLGISKEDVI
jgi:hypothetical protein